MYLVKVIFTRNNVFEWQDSPIIEAEVINEPNGVGDLWHFQKNDIEFMVNPSCPDFLGIEVIENSFELFNPVEIAPEDIIQTRS